MNIIKLKNRFIHFSSVCACILWHEHRESRTICGSLPFFQHLVPRGWAQVVSLGGKRLYPLGHLIPWSLDKHWWWMSFLIYSACGSSYPQSRPPTVRSYSASFPPTPPQTYLWSFPSSFKIKIIFLSTCVCMHVHTSEYRHNVYACQRICVEVIEKNQVSVLAFHLAQHGFLFSAVNARLADPQLPRILMPLPFILPWEWCDYRCVLPCLALCG